MLSNRVAITAIRVLMPWMRWIPGYHTAEWLVVGFLAVSTPAACRTYSSSNCHRFVYPPFLHVLLCRGG
jgi:hypothetical protein